MPKLVAIKRYLMTLEKEQALEIVNTYADSPADFVKVAREYNTTLNQLVNGVDFDKLLSKVESVEKSDDKFKARKKYSRSIKDLNERLLRPVDNVFTATGGSIQTQLQDGSLSNAMDALNHCRGNKSLTKFMSTVWKEAYITDPQGVMFVEVSKDGSKSYPTYKSIQDVNYYKSYGQLLEYILFKPYKVQINGVNETFCRLVDDVKDYTFQKKGNSWVEVEELTFEHIFGKVPAVINSDLERIGTDLKYSILDKVIEIQKEFLRDQSILTLVKFLNGFQNLVRPKILCTSCHGTGKTGDKTCNSCDGSGFLINRDITDEIIIPIDLNNADQKIPSAQDIGRYFGLDTETWNQYRDELKILEVLIYEALWGTHMTNQDNQTATAKFIDTQPVINKLNMISDNAEYVNQELANLIIKHNQPSLDKGKTYITINNGRRFIIDPPNALLESYQNAREKGLSQVILDRMYNEYLTAKYKGDEQMLRIMLMKTRVEPYVHYTAEQINSILGSEEAFKKVKFGEWWKNIKDPLSYESEDRLRSEFESYLEEEQQNNINNEGS